MKKLDSALSATQVSVNRTKSKSETRKALYLGENEGDRLDTEGHYPIRLGHWGCDVND